MVSLGEEKGKKERDLGEKINLRTHRIKQSIAKHWLMQSVQKKIVGKIYTMLLIFPFF